MHPKRIARRPRAGGAGRSLAGLTGAVGRRPNRPASRRPTRRPAEVKVDKNRGPDRPARRGGPVRPEDRQGRSPTSFVRNEDVLQVRLDPTDPKALLLTGRRPRGHPDHAHVQGQAAGPMYDVVVQPDYDLLRNLIRRTVPTANVDVVPGRRQRDHPERVRDQPAGRGHDHPAGDQRRRREREQRDQRDPGRRRPAGPDRRGRSPRWTGPSSASRGFDFAVSGTTVDVQQHRQRAAQRAGRVRGGGCRARSARPRNLAVRRSSRPSSSAPCGPCGPRGWPSSWPSRGSSPRPAARRSSGPAASRRSSGRPAGSPAPACSPGAGRHRAGGAADRVRQRQDLAGDQPAGHGR